MDACDNNPWHVESVESFLNLKCPICEKEFLLKHNLHVHVHQEKSSYICPHCESRFESNNNSIKIVKNLKTRKVQ